MSDEQTTCAKCGVVILALTAQETGGVCMVCKRSSREAFEQNRREMKAFEAEQAAFRAGPVWQFWLSLTRSSPEQMTLNQRRYFAVGCLRGDVFNGGLHQYFWNHASKEFEYAVEGLIAMDAERHLRLLVAAKKVLFGEGDIPDDAGLERRLREVMDDAAANAELDELDRQFWAEPDELWTAMMQFGAHHGFFPAPQDRT